MKGFFIPKMKTHQQNIQDYLSNGGDPKVIQSLKISNMQNRGRLIYLLGKLNIKPAGLNTPVLREPEESAEPVKVRKSAFSDFISQYPTELHATYKKRYEVWLEACSLKVSLNEVSDDDIDAALVIQDKIMQSFSDFDKCQEALDYFNEHKRVLATKSEKDYTELSPVEMLQQRNLLRSCISKRKATLKKKIDELPDPIDDRFKMKQNAVNRKKEELQELELQEADLNKLLK